MDGKSVSYAYSLGIVNGTSGTLFSPKNSITREQAATMLTRLLSSQNISASNGTVSSFSDVGKVSSWATNSVNYISSCIGNGKAIMGGSDGKFNPKGSYTKEQAIMTLYRTYKFIESMKADVETNPVNSTDVVNDPVDITDVVNNPVNSTEKVDESDNDSLTQDDTFIEKEIKDTERTDEKDSEVKNDESDKSNQISEPMSISLTGDIPSETKEDTVVVEGHINNCVSTAVLQVKNKTVAIDSDGNFKATLQLEEGDNTFTFELYNKSELKAKKYIKIKRIIEYKYVQNSTGITITSYGGTDTDIEIPYEIDGWEVTAIGNRAFAGSKIKSVIVHSKVTYLGYAAFDDCSQLETAQGE
jgi:hypothetical protein